MHIAIDIGHNIPGADIGAGKQQGLYSQECILAKELGNKIKDILQSRGHRVSIVTPTSAYNEMNSLQKRVQRANSLDVDYYVSLHFNSFYTSAANGTEVYTYSPNSKANKKARQILNNISNLGFRNRGVKNARFYVLANTKMPALLIEGCFLTSPEDMSKLDISTMAKAIANGILDMDFVEDVVEYATLEVLIDTVIKETTLQSSDPKVGLKKNIKKGTYKVEYFTTEDKHHLIKVPEIHNDKMFIYADYCSIK